MIEEKKAYFVYAFKLDKSSGEVYIDVSKTGVKSLRERTWGWFTSFDSAFKTVEHCANYIFEHGYYDHVLIEEIPEGFCNSFGSKTWLKAEFDEDHSVTNLVIITTPENFVNLCNFSIG